MINRLLVLAVVVVAFFIGMLLPKPTLETNEDVLPTLYVTATPNIEAYFQNIYEYCEKSDLDCDFEETIGKSLLESKNYTKFNEFVTTCGHIQDAKLTFRHQIDENMLTVTDLEFLTYWEWKTCVWETFYK